MTALPDNATEGVEQFKVTDVGVQPALPGYPYVTTVRGFSHLFGKPYYGLTDRDLNEQQVIGAVPSGLQNGRQLLNYFEQPYFVLGRVLTANLDGLVLHGVALYGAEKIMASKELVVGAHRADTGEADEARTAFLGLVLALAGGVSRLALRVTHEGELPQRRTAAYTAEAWRRTWRHPVRGLWQPRDVALDVAKAETDGHLSLRVGTAGGLLGGLQAASHVLDALEQAAPPDPSNALARDYPLRADIAAAYGYEAATLQGILTHTSGCDRYHAAHALLVAGLHPEVAPGE